jgi:solute carrier family 25 citrate transporter 1
MLAGTVSGGTEAIITWPAENIKTRLQLNNKYKSSFECFKSTIEKRGFLSIYRGLSPVLLGAIPKYGVRFGSFNYFSDLVKDEDGVLTPIRSLGVGLLSGACEASFAVTPVETLKTKLIDNNKGFINGVYDIVKREGIKGFYRGLGPTILKQSTNQGMRFMLYNEIKKLLNSHNITGTTSSGLAGMGAGIISTVINNPIDVIKTRMQGSDAKQYTGIIDCFQKRWKIDRYGTLTRGLGPRLLRGVPGQAIIYALYDEILDQMIDDK